MALRRYLFRWDGKAWQKGPYSGYTGVRIGSIFARHPRGGLDVLTLEPSHKSGTWVRFGRTTKKLGRKMSPSGCIRHSELFTGMLDAEAPDEEMGIDELLVTDDDVLLLCADGVERWVGDAGVGAFSPMPIADGKRKLVRSGADVRVVGTRPGGKPFVAKRVGATWVVEDGPPASRALVFAHADGDGGALFREVGSARVHSLAPNGTWTATEAPAIVTSIARDRAGALWVATADQPPRLLHQTANGWQEVVVGPDPRSAEGLSVRRVGPVVVVASREGVRATTKVEERALPAEPGRGTCPSKTAARNR
jgi:hypothetical protein